MQTTLRIETQAENTPADGGGAPNQPRWFALRVKSNRENVVAGSLAVRGYEALLPKFKPFGASPKLGERPLFPGYVFGRFDVSNRLPILTLPGLVHIVGIGKTPIPIDDDEIHALRIAVDSSLPLRRVEYSPGDPVQISRGPLAGAKGVVAGRRNEQFIVSITLLQRSVSVDLRSEWIVPLCPRA